MLAGYRGARHDVVLVSDSNVEVDPSYLKATVRRLLEPGVGLVTNPVRGRGGRSLGALFENLHLNTFVAGGTAFLFRFLRPAVRGRQVDALPQEQPRRARRTAAPSATCWPRTTSSGGNSTARGCGSFWRRTRSRT